MHLKMYSLLIFHFLVSMACFSAEPALKPKTTLLQNADIILQTSVSNQSSAILAATGSRYSHMGLIEQKNGKYFVIESVSTVKKTPLDEWKARGRDSKYAIFRFQGLSDEQRKQIIARAHSLEGTPYDIHFSAANDGKKEYCSKLVADAYKGANISLGKWQKVKDLAVDNKTLQKLFKQRYKTHPLCQTTKITFEQCWAKVLEDTLITPSAIASDTRLVLIESNYP